MWFGLKLVKMDGYNNIYGSDTFVNDFCNNILGMSKDRVLSQKAPKSAKQYVSWLVRSLTILDTQGPATTRLKGFEKLSGADGIYSARYPNTQKNPRILYFYIQDSKIVLLYSFCEKNKSDYQRGIETAKERKATFEAQWPLDE